MNLQKIGTLAFLAATTSLALALPYAPARAEDLPPAQATAAEPVEEAFDASPWDGIPTRVLAGRRCVNEATWNTTDCAVIISIAIRNARNEGLDLREWLLRHHGRRSLHPERCIPTPDARGRIVPRLSITHRNQGRTRTITDDRPWIGDLNAEMREPQMWTWHNTMRWDTRGIWHWTQILETVDGILAGTLRDPSGGRASIWGGPELDADAIAQRLVDGFVQVRIQGTLNHYFRRP
jgi:hypothetical protein